VKLFEHMAAGKPVVASPMREILKYQSVLFAGTPEDFVQRVETALHQRQDPAYCQLLEREARENTWQQRAEALRHAIESVRTAQGGLPRRARSAPSTPRNTKPRP
jgi:teichuronic acid biosynthesis glycosyltransferase TuaH